MADNVDWILSQAPAGTKIVLWAHNGHVSRMGMGGTSMGSHLARRHGRDYLVLGFAAHQGLYTAVARGVGLGTHPLHASQPGSIEYYGHCSGLPRMMIDLRRASKDNRASAWLTKALHHRSIGALAQDVSYSAVLPDEYDALIFFDDTSASACFRLPASAQVKKQPDARRR
jgi:erythromycin esterase